MDRLHNNSANISAFPKALILFSISSTLVVILFGILVALLLPLTTTTVTATTTTTINNQKMPFAVGRRIVVTRHGSRLDNGPDRDPHWLAKAPHNRPSDAPLSPLGHQEARELAVAIQQKLAQNENGDDNADNNNNNNNNHNTNWKIISSPYIRCLETALHVAELLKCQIQVEPGIAEVGSTVSSMASQDELLSDGYPFSSRMDASYSPVMTREQLPAQEFGDSAAARRAHRVAQTIARDKFPDSNLVFVGHGASCLGLVTAFGAPQEYIGYCSVTQFQQQVDSKNNHYKLVGTLGDVSHLSNPQVSLDSAW